MKRNQRSPQPRASKTNRTSASFPGGVPYTIYLPRGSKVNQHNVESWDELERISKETWAKYYNKQN